MAQHRPETIPRAERTIAQVLAEELQCSAAFSSFFVRRVLSDLLIEGGLGEAEVDLVRGCAGVDEGYDLEARLNVGPLAMTMLVAVRFAHRASLARKAKAKARQLVETGSAALGSAIWVTTATEAARVDGELVYDRIVSIDALLKELRHEAACSAYELQRRREFHVMLIERAVETADSAKAQIGDETDAFWSAYFDLVHDAAPDLQIDEARASSAPSSGLLIFDADTLPAWPFMPTVRLAHHLREGVASILIHDWGEDIEGLAEVMQPALDGTSYHLAQAPGRLDGAKPGALILVDTPVLDPAQPFETQRRGAQRCVAEIAALRTWFTTRKSVARYWAEFISPTDTPTRQTRVRRNVRLA